MAPKATDVTNPSETPTQPKSSEKQLTGDAYKVELSVQDEHVLVVKVQWKDQHRVLRKSTKFKDCGVIEADHKEIEGNRDLHLVQLLCTNGEDFMYVESMTALLHVRGVGDTSLLWSGYGTSSNELGCVKYDVRFFRLQKTGKVAVLRERGVNDAGAEKKCREQKRTEKILKVLELKSPAP
ncbi:MAG: hypothetical protein ACPG4T_21895 [Nannocystaceae bacterium]